MERNEIIEADVVSLMADRISVDWKRLASLRPADRQYIEKLKALESIIQANGRLFEPASPAKPPAAGLPDKPPATAPRLTGKETAPPAGPLLKKWGRLEILELLGRGSYGEVYKAHDTVLQRVVALKLRRSDDGMEGDAEERFLKEARRLARVRHENVVAVHGADVHDGRVGLWTDYLPGRTLEETLKSHGPIGYREAALIGLDLCRALAAVHAAGLIHRDIKPANVLKTDDGRTMLLDFGAATRDVTREAGIEESAPMGTLLYLAPETLLGEPATPQGDIYSLGVLLFRLASGQYPAWARSVHEMAQKHVSGSQVSLRELRPDIPFSFVEVVERAIAINPADRYSGVAEMERGLARVMAWVEAPAKGRVASRTTLVAMASATGLAALVLVLLLGRLQTASHSPEIALLRESAGGIQKLEMAARVQPGDRISLTFRSGRKTFLYAIDEDTEGQVYRLFPLPGLEPGNPLPPNVTHQVPGIRDGVEQKWTIGADGSGETILVIASLKPLPNLENLLATVPTASPMDMPVEDRVDSGAAVPDRTDLVINKAITHYSPAVGEETFLDRLEREALQGDARVVIQRFNLSRPTDTHSAEKPK